MAEYGVGICTYNRGAQLAEIVRRVRETVPSGTRVVVCDDGSDEAPNFKNVVTVRGPNLGVAANKNRALFALQDCKFLCILEDDLMPTDGGWFEAYVRAATISGIHHFCRVQDKLEDSKSPAFDEFMLSNDLHPIYGPSPRGDLTFLTAAVLRVVGGFNPLFRGVGHAHGEWSNRVQRAGLINHPNKWVDIVEGGAKFEQIGDTEGGRWDDDEKVIKRQIQRNVQILKQLQKTDYTHHPLVLE
jgi:glycosyltransferase involved in cell wall biosynthesis